MPSKPRSGSRRVVLTLTGLLAGVDEAGRGPLAGPVVAAAVMLDEKKRIRGLADSKVLTARVRERLYDEVRAKALCCAVGVATVEEIDAVNILQATFLAMRRAVEGLRLRPHGLLIDGNRLPAIEMPMQAIVDGDAKVAAISAASIIAKVHRDRLCVELHERHPEYGFDEHKGYSTPQHLAALRRHGACPHHRRSFAPVRQVLEFAPEREGPELEPAREELELAPTREELELAPTREELEVAPTREELEVARPRDSVERC